MQKKFPIPKYIEKKNEELVQLALEHTKKVISEISTSDAIKIGSELLSKNTSTLEKYIVKVGTQTTNDGIRLYLPEILALTAGSCLLGAVIGYNWKTIIKKMSK